MKQTLKTLTLIAIGVAVGRVSKRKNKPQVSIRILDLDDYKSKIEQIKNELSKLKS